MKIVVVGGGKVGYYVAKTLLESGNEVSVIEQNDTTARIIADELDIPVICDDGTTVEALLAAGTVNADALVAVTGSDEANIVTAQIAKRKFEVDRVITRANDPKNVAAMRMLGTDIAVSSTQIITDLIDSEIDIDVKMLATLNNGEAKIIELTAKKDFNPEKKPLSMLEIPQNCVIIAVISNGKLTIPRGGTVISPGDRITAIAKGNEQKALKKLFM